MQDWRQEGRRATRRNGCDTHSLADQYSAKVSRNCKPVAPAVYKTTGDEVWAIIRARIDASAVLKIRRKRRGAKFDAVPFYRPPPGYLVSIGIFVKCSEGRNRLVANAFDTENALLVVYGVPDKIDLKNPQAEYLSVYSMRPGPHMIMERMYGGGIYEIAFGVNRDLIYVASRFGFEIIDIGSMKIKSFSPFEEPKFSRQTCGDR